MHLVDFGGVLEGGSGVLVMGFGDGRAGLCFFRCHSFPWMVLCGMDE